MDEFIFLLYKGLSFNCKNDLSEGNRLLDLYIFYAINDLMVMRRSNRTYHIPRAYPGHLAIFRAQGVGNLTRKAFPMVGI